MTTTTILSISILFPFLTAWSLAAHILARARVIPFNTFLLSFIVSCGGLVLTYAHPKYIVAGPFVISGWTLHTFDLMFHHVPFAWMLRVRAYQRLQLQDVAFSFVFLLVYMYCYNPVQVYHL